MNVFTYFVIHFVDRNTSDCFTNGQGYQHLFSLGCWYVI